LVVDVEEREAVGDRLEAARLRRRVAILGYVGAVHDLREERDRRVVDPVLRDEGLERALPIAMVYLAPGASKLIASSRSA